MNIVNKGWSIKKTAGLGEGTRVIHADKLAYTQTQSAFVYSGLQCTVVACQIEDLAGP